jgi:membrane protein YqaA with SNARE-associated domain
MSKNERRTRQKDSAATSVPQSALQPQTNAIQPAKLILRSVLLLVALVSVAVILILLDVPLDRIGRAAASRGGLIGIFVFVFVVDTFIVPASLDILLPITMTWSPLPLLTVMSAASVLGGICGYWIGRTLYRVRFVRRTVAGYYARGARIIERYGVWGVVLAGFTPLPFSTVSWIAGMLRLPFGLFALAALSRVPRITAYWFLLRAGVRLMV